MQTIELDGARFVVQRGEQASRPLVVYGPLPLVSRSLLLLRVRPIRSSDRRAVRVGAARRVQSLDPALDEVAFFETELGDEPARALVPAPARAVLARTIGKHRAVLRVRRDFAHVEISPRHKDAVSSEEVTELVTALAAISHAARRMPPDALVAVRDEGWAPLGVAIFLAAFGVLIARATLLSTRLTGPGNAVVLAAVLIAAAIAFGIVRALLRQQRRPSTTSHRTAFDVALTVALAVGVLAMVVVPKANQRLDTAAAAEQHASIVQVRFYKSGSVREVCARLETGATECIDVSPAADDIFDSRDAGARIVITMRAGGLGLSWIERVRRAGPTE